MKAIQGESASRILAVVWVLADARIHVADDMRLHLRPFTD